MATHNSIKVWLWLFPRDSGHFNTCLSDTVKPKANSLSLHSSHPPGFVGHMVLLSTAESRLPPQVSNSLTHCCCRAVSSLWCTGGTSHLSRHRNGCSHSVQSEVQHGCIDLTFLVVHLLRVRNSPTRLPQTRHAAALSGRTAALGHPANIRVPSEAGGQRH